MEREEYIRSRAGKENPFRVPEGYFEGLASQVMANLPDRDAAPVRTARTSFIIRKMTSGYFM